MALTAEGPPAGLGLAPGRGVAGRIRDAGLRRLTALLAAPLNRAYRAAAAGAAYRRIAADPSIRTAAERVGAELTALGGTRA